MRTLQPDGGVRAFFVVLVAVVALVVSACGSSSSSTSSSTTSTMSSTTASTADAPAAATSIPPSPSTIPPTLQAPCTALTSALEMSELHPRTTGNWPAERQRIITDTAVNVELFTAASNGVPADIAKALDTLKGYSTWLGETVADASSFDAAMSAVNAYPDLVGASLATSVVETWKRKNC